MAGLKICTRWRAISARRRRRISSSLLPENMGPTMTSIQPILPLTMSTVAPWQLFSFPLSVYKIQPAEYCAAPLNPSLLAHSAARSRYPDGRSTIHLRVIERGEGGNHGDAKHFLTGDEIVRENAPGSLPVTNARSTREAVDGDGKLGTVFQDFARE